MKQLNNLIQEAKKRGYRSGTIIYYGYATTGDITLDVNRLGSGEFAIKNGNLVKYEKKLENDNPNFRRFDTVYSAKENKWTEIYKP